MKASRQRSHGKIQHEAVNEGLIDFINRHVRPIIAILLSRALIYSQAKQTVRSEAEAIVETLTPLQAGIMVAL